MPFSNFVKPCEFRAIYLALSSSLSLFASTGVVAQELLAEQTLFFTSIERELYDKQAKHAKAHVTGTTGTGKPVSKMMLNSSLNNGRIRYKGFIHVGNKVLLFFNQAKVKRFDIKPKNKSIAPQQSEKLLNASSGVVELVETMPMQTTLISWPNTKDASQNIEFNVEDVSANLMAAYIRVVPDGRRQKLSLVNEE